MKNEMRSKITSLFWLSCVVFLSSALENVGMTMTCNRCEAQRKVWGWGGGRERERDRDRDRDRERERALSFGIRIHGEKRKALL